MDFCTLLAESKRIINAHSRHFLALSVFFLLPLSFSLTVFPTLQNLPSQSPSDNIKILLFFTHPPSKPNHHHHFHFPTYTIFLSSLFTLFVSLFSLFATGAITYSVFHGFYGRPVKLIAAIKSAFVSFFLLLITVVFAQIVVFGVFLACGGLLFLLFKGFRLVGFEIEVFSPAFTAFFGVVLIVSVFFLINLQVNWSLACVIVVVEARWGFEALKRSNLLIKGMKKLAFLLLLVFQLCVGIMTWANVVVTLSVGGTGDGWKTWAFVAQIVQNSAVLTLLFLYFMAANTVLYMHCKAVHGELVWEIAEEFAREYVSLPFDDEKVPHVVSVAYV